MVKIASTAVVTKLLGGTKEDVINAVSNAFVDGQSLRTYRHSPNTGSRKSWAAGDATSRAVRLAWMTMQGEMGYPGALTAKTWGFYDVLFKGKPFKFQRDYGSYVMEQVLFKISFPAEFHAQTAVECSFQLNKEVGSKLQTLEQIVQIDKIVITTHESAIRIIDKTGPLDNPADRDHCIQYMSAIGLLKGNLTAQDYEDVIADDPRIDALRAKMVCVEKAEYTRDYLDPDKRSIANAIQILFKDGSQSSNIAVEYPIGHRRRREEGIPELVKKFQKNLARRFNEKTQAEVLALCLDQSKLESTNVDTFVDMLEAS